LFAVALLIEAELWIESGTHLEMTFDLEYLLEQCRAGNPLAWEALVRGYQGRAYSLAFYYLGNAEEAKDAAQEVFLRIYRNIGQCRDEAMFLPWLIKISRNLCIDLLRKKAARPTAADFALDEIPESADPDLNPEESWLAKSRRQLIHRALRQLTALNREIVILKEIHGMALEQIASLLKIPLGTAKSRSNRARLELTEKVLALSKQFVQPASSTISTSEEPHELPEV
jgi:RNA polymerase sigma-70 factor (ECF subfamily)